MKPEGEKVHGLLHYTALAFAFILCVAVVYVLSTGPVGKAVNTINALKPYEPRAVAFYKPLVFLDKHCPAFDDFMEWYLFHLWQIK